ncbi:hypothetical protein FLP10_00885 [Agromyces intestinalis]|uniref:Lipoprotein n=1 Tax=Agromyces intestinalis TaxID=2592652 RepID=A0A5C1YAZ7_9MICO|nr:hypothetical protein [Agromyces intestinalis]QEO13126.1 hypothetical protein FLP10_00885 [Agromyces intestinalis]
MTRSLPRIAAVVATAAALAFTGCAAQPAGAGSTGGGPDAATVDLLVRDAQLRVAGDACSGARPYQHIHRGSELVLEHADERLAVELPDGEAVRIDDLDYGAAPRIPTACRFRLDVPGLTADTEYAVTIDGRAAGTYRYLDTDTPPIAVPPLADPNAILETGDR